MTGRTLSLYNTADGKASVSLYAKDGMVWMNQMKEYMVKGFIMDDERRLQAGC